ncbi:hypothetical protein BV22DRAFT_480200 [Leucogyrophana mollusca]|uniref:Uncharacterized protein n=1 Tax=Leucogyrophana mollusca TaxID=85980 RepID=A0ACB8BG18_9AGAM|nr:hypothetical protein BV22DRAFT_480200 [Leucogyrophana mollusca]
MSAPLCTRWFFHNTDPEKAYNSYHDSDTTPTPTPYSPTSTPSKTTTPTAMSPRPHVPGIFPVSSSSSSSGEQHNGTGAGALPLQFKTYTPFEWDTCLALGGVTRWSSYSADLTFTDHRSVTRCRTRGGTTCVGLNADWDRTRHSKSRAFPKNLGPGGAGGVGWTRCSSPGFSDLRSTRRTSKLRHANPNSNPRRSEFKFWQCFIPVIGRVVPMR